MPPAPWSTWLRSRPHWLRGVALGLVASMALVFSAPLWHHHDGVAGHDGDSCAVCAVAASPTGDGLPDHPPFEPPALGELVRWMGAERLAVLWAGRDRASRGPPAGVA